MTRKSKFFDSWFENPLYSAWIVPGKVDTCMLQCKWCCKDVDVLNMTESALKSHISITLPYITVNH